jgi:hypothetical protein
MIAEIEQQIDGLTALREHLRRRLAEIEDEIAAVPVTSATTGHQP